MALSKASGEKSTILIFVLVSLLVFAPVSPLVLFFPLRAMCLLCSPGMPVPGPLALALIPT
jgi:hypothetical protein